MTEKVKDVYEDEAVVADMVERYTSAEDSDEARAAVVKELAEELGKSEASVRSKLVREDVYVAKVRAPKGGKVEKKGEIVDRIVADLAASFAINVSDGEAESLEKANKTVLRKIEKALKAEVEFTSD